MTDAIPTISTHPELLEEESKRALEWGVQHQPHPMAFVKTPFFLCATIIVPK
jgi:hypothetical protein